MYGLTNKKIHAAYISLLFVNLNDYWTKKTNFSQIIVSRTWLRMVGPWTRDSTLVLLLKNSLHEVSRTLSGSDL